MSVMYNRRRKERRKVQVAQRWRENDRRAAMIYGDVTRIGIAWASFTQMGFFARLWWVLTGRFDHIKALRNSAPQQPATASDVANVPAQTAAA